MYKIFILLCRDMPFYYAGFNTSTLFCNDEDISFITDSFTKVSFPGITDFQIGWSYFLIWKGNKLYISKKFKENNKDTGIDTNIQLIQLPEKSLDRYIFGFR